MYAAKGIGLAAVQVNLPIRLIVIDISETRNEPIILVNPIINDRKEKIIFSRKNSFFEYFSFFRI